MWMLVWAALAHAQDAAPTPGDVRWMVADVQAARFVNTDSHKVSFATDDRVTVIAVDGLRARVSNEGTYGWVVLTALTAEAPAIDATGSELLDNPALTTPIQIPGLGGGLQLGGPK